MIFRKLLKKIKKKNFFIILILVILHLSYPEIKGKNKFLENMDNRLLIYLKKNITLLDYHAFSNEYILEKIKDWIEYYQKKINFEDRNILIRKDYLNLIEVYPSKNNIKSNIIEIKIRESENKKEKYVKNIEDLKEDYKYFSSKGYFYIYKIKYNYKNLRLGKRQLKDFNWVALCFLNRKHKKEINVFRQKLLDNLFPTIKKEIISLINNQDIKIPKSKIDNKICRNFRDLQNAK